MSRRILIGVVLAGIFAAPAAGQSTLLMPGVTYSRQVQFTPHGPVVLHVLTAPKPGGLWDLRPVLSNGTLLGRERVTGMERDVSEFGTVAGVNGDFFTWASGTPSGIFMQDGVLKAPPHDLRSSIGIGLDGTLQVRRVQLFGTWQGLTQRYPVNGLNQPPAPNNVSLFTPAWGTSTPAGNSVEAVIQPFPPLALGNELSGPIVQLKQGGNTRIPANGAVLVARGSAAGRLANDAPVGTRVTLRVSLNPDWKGVMNAIGGGPIVVRDGQPVFRAFEDFTPSQISPRDPRTAVGQRADGRIVMIVVDGRQPGYSVGMSNFELAQALVRFGAVTGAALDSGGSSTMAFDGQLLNHPSDPGGERAVSEALLVFYYGIYAPPAPVTVLSPNGDGVGERQALAYKVVRPSVVSARLIGPDKIARVTQEQQRSPGTYRLSWTGTTPSGGSELEGRWHWVVSAIDDRGRASSLDRGFWLNNTLGFLNARPVFTARKKRSGPVGTFKLAHAARVTATIETRTGVRMRTLLRGVQLETGTRTLIWNGRDAKRRLVYGGRYLLRVRAANSFGPAELFRPFVVRRR